MTTLTTPEQIHAFAGLSIRGQLRLIKVGMKSRIPTRDILAAVTRHHTGRTYKRNDIDLAIADLTAKYRLIM